MVALTYDIALQHFQHGIKSVYPYLSLKLWFHLKYNTSKNLCFTAQGPAKQFFYKRHIWMDDLFASVQSLTGPYFFESNADWALVEPKRYFNLQRFFTAAPSDGSRVDFYKHGPHTEKLFVHKSAAHRIASIALNRDPCRFSNDIKTRMNTLPVLKIINRKKSRHFVNIGDVASYLSNIYRSPPIEIVYFEDLAFQKQAEIVADTDILITAHGAAEG